MGDEDENCTELYNQRNVLVKSHAPCNNDIDFRHNPGTLSVVDYKSNLGKCVEWHQCDVSIETDDQEWAIVQDVKGRTRTVSESIRTLKAPIIQLQLKNVISFKVSKNNQQLTFIERGGVTHTTFLFQHGNADCLVSFLKGIVKTSNCKKDPNLYLVMDTQEVQVLEKSFAELDLFTDESSRHDAVWNFVKKFHDSPYEATMSAFSKVTDVLLYRPQNQTDEVVEWLNRSLTADEIGELNGRISSEDYELITKGPPLPPRTLPLRCPPLTADQWANFFDSEGRITESDLVKEIIFHGGIKDTEGLRKEVWKFLLDYYPWDSTINERDSIRKKKVEEYYTMKLQWKSMSVAQEDRFTGFKERKSLIEKDVYRTDRTMEFFAGDNNPNLELLQDILMTYVMYNFDLGYVQGMSDLLSPLLVKIRDEVDTFWCFVGFMERVCRNFDLDQAGMKEQLHHLYCLLCAVEPELASYLDRHESNNMSFCFRWLLVWFKREFKYEDVFQLWEVLWTESLCKNFHLLICVAILDNEKETLMSKNFGFTEILKHINDLANNLDLEPILRKAEGIYLQIKTAARIPNPVREIIGLEPLPELEISETETENNENNQTNGNNAEAVHNGIHGNIDTISFSVDTQELAFEQSMNMQYL